MSVCVCVCVQRVHVCVCVCLMFVCVCVCVCACVCVSVSVYVYVYIGASGSYMSGDERPAKMVSPAPSREGTEHGESREGSIRQGIRSLDTSQRGTRFLFMYSFICLLEFASGNRSLDSSQRGSNSSSQLYGDLGFSLGFRV